MNTQPDSYITSATVDLYFIECPNCDRYAYGAMTDGYRIVYECDGCRRATLDSIKNPQHARYEQD